MGRCRRTASLNKYRSYNAFIERPSLNYFSVSGSVETVYSKTVTNRGKGNTGDKKHVRLYTFRFEIKKINLGIWNKRNRIEYLVAANFATGKVFSVKESAERNEGDVLAHTESVVGY